MKAWSHILEGECMTGWTSQGHKRKMLKAWTSRKEVSCLKKNPVLLLCWPPLEIQFSLMLYRTSVHRNALSGPVTQSLHVAGTQGWRRNNLHMVTFWPLLCIMPFSHKHDFCLKRIKIYTEHIIGREKNCRQKQLPNSIAREENMFGPLRISIALISQGLFNRRNFVPCVLARNSLTQPRFLWKFCL